MANVYVNPFTDYGFKKIFGEEASKPILIDFLNALVSDEQGKIKEITFKNNQQLGQGSEGKGVIFDLYCETETGEKFIVELQKNKQDWFKERAVYYSTFPIQEQVNKGDLKYDLKAVYCIGVLDFIFPGIKNPIERNEVKHEIQLTSKFGSVFYDKLTYIFLLLPNFNKIEAKLETRIDKWLYFIKNLKGFQNIPEIFKNEVVFEMAFEKAQIAKMTVTEFYNYEMSNKVVLDYEGGIRTAVNEAVAEAVAKTEKKAAKAIKKEQQVAKASLKKEREAAKAAIKKEREATEASLKKEREAAITNTRLMAKTLKDNGVALNIIAKSTGLTEKEITAL